MATVNTSISTNSDQSAQAESISSRLGMAMNGTINTFLQQSVGNQAIPLSLTLSSEQSLYVDLLKARADRMNGLEYMDADDVLTEIDKAVERGHPNV